MARKQQPPPKKPAELEAEVRALLEQRLRDEGLRSKLEALAPEQAFNGPKTILIRVMSWQSQMSSSGIVLFAVRSRRAKKIFFI